jgi:hypothetical protein
LFIRVYEGFGCEEIERASMEERRIDGRRRRWCVDGKKGNGGWRRQREIGGGDEESGGNDGRGFPKKIGS